jgi:hypothetical protein
VNKTLNEVVPDFWTIICELKSWNQQVMDPMKTLFNYFCFSTVIVEIKSLNRVVISCAHKFINIYSCSPWGRLDTPQIHHIYKISIKFINKNPSHGSNTLYIIPKRDKRCSSIGHRRQDPCFVVIGQLVHTVFTSTFAFVTSVRKKIWEARTWGEWIRPCHRHHHQSPSGMLVHS